MIVYHVFDSNGENFIFETSDIEAIQPYVERDFEVVSVSVEDRTDMWSDYQI